ncbi:MAG: LiaF transmembrane domain-containing protein [Anaerolineaceae bacterium]
MSENNFQNIRRDERRVNIFFPLLLIIIGVFFLMSNLNMIPGDAGSLFIRFWPLLFVIGGLEDLFNGRWVGAVINVGIGVILVLANLGYFPWTAWQMIWKIWPIFIIAIGLDIVFKGRSMFGSLIGVSISVLIIAGIIWISLNSSIVGKGTISPVDFELGGLDKVKIEISPAIGSLDIDGNAPAAQLLVGNISLAKEENLSDEFSINGKAGTLQLKSEGTVFFPSRTTTGGFPWLLSLNDDVSMDMTIHQGVGQQNLDLSKLNISGFEIKLGVGQAIINLPEEDVFEGEITCGIGELVVNIPRDMPIKIKIDSGITSTEYPDGYIEEGDWLYSPNAKTSNELRILSLNNPIGSLKISIK